MKRNKISIMMALAALLMGGHAAAQSSDAQLPEFIANLVYETDINNSVDNLRGIYKFKPAQTIQLDTVYVSPTLLELREDVDDTAVARMRISQVEKNKEILSTTE